MIRTLVVDDEKYVRKGFIAVMPWEKSGFKVAGEESGGHRALEFLEHNEVDLVITDISMPGMSGFSLMEEIHKLYPDMWIAVLTCHQDFGYIQDAMRLGAIDYIVKTQLEMESMELVLERIAKRIEHDRKARCLVSLEEVDMNSHRAQLEDSSKYSEEIVHAIMGSVRYIKDNLLKGINQYDVAKAANMSRSYFSTSFKDIMGVSFSEYTKKVRVHAAKEMLSQTNRQIYWIAEQLGFKDEKYFSRMFREKTGATPSEYRGKNSL